MKVQIPPFRAQVTADFRKAVVSFAAETINRRSLADIPYMPNEGDSTFWTIDMGNNWKIKFFDDEPDVFEVIHRYQNKQAIAALAGWLAFRLGGKILS